MNPKASVRRRATRAFTLVEVMLAMAIFTLLGAMMLSLIIGTTKTLYAVEKKTAIDRNFRTTTSALSQLVEAADYTYVIPSYDSMDSPVAPGERGDMFVAVFYRNPNASVLKNGKMVQDTTVARIVGFCRMKGAGDTEGKTGYPVYQFDSKSNDWGVDFSKGAAADETYASIAKLLPSPKAMVGFTKLADSAFATNVPDSSRKDGKIFLNNVSGTGALMLARIREGSVGNYQSNTYAFSISSRNL